MAGRPRTMAKRVLKLEQRADELYGDFLELIPRQYERNTPRKAPLHAAWHSAMVAVETVSDAFYQLSDLLRERAGITRIEWIRMSGFDVAESTPEQGMAGEVEAVQDGHGAEP